MRIGSAALCASLLASAACGGASTAPGTGPGLASTAAITQYQDLTAEVRSGAISYGTTMAAAGMTAGGCAAVHDAYDAQVRPWLAQLVQTSPSMDAFMDAHGGSAYADVACAANAMLQELDAHALVACTFSTVGDDQAEAARHVGVMTSYAGHVYDRCGEMTGGGYMWGASAPACGGTAGGGTGGGTPSDPLALGQRLFDTGVGTTGVPVPRTGGYGMMGTGGCASCHGYDGLGRIMMMLTTPDVTYANLTDPAGMRDPDGSRGPTYTDDLIRRAVTSGVDAAGGTLSTAMPRWQLGDEDWADLLLFLKSLPAAPAAGGGAGTPPGSGTIGGTAFMGAMRSGSVTAYAVSGGMMATPLGTASLDAAGSFSVPIGAYAGTVLLRLTGGAFVDEATGTAMAMRSGDLLTAAIPLVAAGAATTGVEITPLTAMAQARAQGMGGGMTAANVAAANAAVGGYFGAGDVLATAPMDPAVAGSGAGASAGARNHGMAVAAMSQYAHAIGMTPSSGIFTAMMQDASDGVLDGRMGSAPISMGGMGGAGMGGGMMGGSTMAPNTGTAGLASAMTAFVGSARNASGVAMAEMQPLADQLAASSGTLP